MGPAWLYRSLDKFAFMFLSFPNYLAAALTLLHRLGVHEFPPHTVYGDHVVVEVLGAALRAPWLLHGGGECSAGLKG